MTIVLGPCRCQGCSKSVYFDGSKWCDDDGLGHDCGRRIYRSLRLTFKGWSTVKWPRRAA